MTRIKRAARAVKAFATCCWHRKPADLYSCRYCGIPFSMTQDQFWAHQRTVHPFTRNGVPVR